MKKKSFRFIGIILLVVLILTFIIVILAKKNDNTTRIAFYDIPHSYEEAYKEVIINEEKENIEFITLTEEDINSKNFIKKIDLLITYNGYITQSLKDKAISLNSDITSRFPRTITSSPLYTYEDKNVIFPISLDLFETLILSTAVNHYKLPVPSFIEEIEEYGLMAGKIYPIPLVISGSDDKTLNCFFTQVIEAFGGLESYLSIEEQIKEDPTLSNFYNYTVTSSSNNEVIKVSNILDLIKEWEDKSVLSKTWRTTTKENTAQLIEDNRTTLAFMTLNEHRNVSSDNLSYYETILFPSYSENNSKNRCSIQPCVVGISFSNKEEIINVINSLTSSNTQELLSLKTLMGPATLQGTSFDRQADDARFIAASFPSGPVPDLATLCFSDKEMHKKMADLIRNY